MAPVRIRDAGRQKYWAKPLRLRGGGSLRHARARLATISIGSAALLLAGCTSGAMNAASGGTQGTAEAHGDASMRTPGVEPCSSLVEHLGEPAPDEGLAPRRLACLSPGPDIDVSALGTRPSLINIWATWCGPCREEMPLLRAGDEKYGDRVTFVGVDTKDDPRSAAAYLAELRVSYPQLRDPGGELLQDRRLPGLPVTLLLRSDGTVQRTKVGAFDDRAELETALDSLLEGVS